MTAADTLGAAEASFLFAFLRISAFMVSAPFPGRLAPAPVRVLGGLSLLMSFPQASTDVIWVRLR